jgi:hypothetical protein
LVVQAVIEAKIRASVMSEIERRLVRFMQLCC